MLDLLCSFLHHSVYMIFIYNILTFNTYIALIRIRSKRFTSIVLQYDLEI